MPAAPMWLAPSTISKRAPGMREASSRDRASGIAWSASLAITTGHGLSFERLGQGPADVGAALGHDLLDVLRGGRERLVGPRDRRVAEARDFRAEGDDVEAIARVEVPDAILDGRAGLLDLLAPHRAARVEHEDHVLVEDLLFGHAAGGVADEHEVAVLVALFTMGQQSHAQLVGVGHPAEPKIVLAGVVVGLDPHPGLIEAVALDRGVVRGAEDSAERPALGAGDHRGDREPCDRAVVPGRGGRGAREPAHALPPHDRLPVVDNDLYPVLKSELRHEQGRPAGQGQHGHRIELSGDRFVEGLCPGGIEELGGGQHGVVAVGDAGGHHRAG